MSETDNVWHMGKVASTCSGKGNPSTVWSVQKGTQFCKEIEFFIFLKNDECAGRHLKSSYK